MPLLAKFRSTLRWLLRRGHLEAELDEEFRDHWEREVESNVNAGMPLEEARVAAQRLIGQASLYKDECRDARGAGLVESFIRDLRYAVRMWGRAPLFTAVAIATLALGIGANSTIFTFVESILLRSLPSPHAEELVSLNWGGMVNISYPNYLDFRDRNTVFSNLAACRYNPANLSVGPRQNFRVWGYEATGNYFSMLGLKPLLGRFFGPEEDAKPGAHPVLVISYGFWKSRFAGNPNVIGKQIKVNGLPFTIIGVAPASFQGTELIVTADYWAPMSMELQIEPGNDWLKARGSQQLWLLGRLKPGVTRTQAEADLDRISGQLARAYPNDLDPKAKFYLSRPGLIGQALRGPIASFGVVLMGVAGAVLLLACTNLAGMLLARASDRCREFDIRLALGAGRLQLLRQLLTESLLLAISGGLLGLALAFGACHLFSSWQLGFDLPVTTELRPNTYVLLFTLGVALATTLLFGFTPALQAIRKTPARRRVHRWGVRDVLVTAQIALSLILVVSSVLVVRSLRHALTLNLGFRPAGAVSVSFDPRLQGYSEERSRRLDSELLQKAAQIPGLASVGIINNLPLRTGENNDVVSRADRPMPKPEGRRSAIVYTISPDYLRTAGTRLLMGRDVNAQDRKDALPVAVVNQALVHLLFGEENPLGKRIRKGGRELTIVGVVETGKYESLGEDPHPAVFQPLAQSGLGWTTLVARTPLHAEEATELLRKTVLDLDPDLTIFNSGSLEDQLALPLFPARIAAIVLGTFGFLAMMLSATGLFALMSYTVSRRTREIGVRMALGARPAQVLSAVLRRTLLLCAIGLSIGIATALATGRMLGAILYGVDPRDPATYAVAILLMAVVAFAASWNPAARAIQVDPARSLREQ